VAELVVLAVIDHLALGGAEMLLGQFAAAAPQAGIRLQVAYFQDGDGNPAAESLCALGTEPFNLAAEGRPGRRHLQAMLRHIRAVKPDIVHTHLGTSDLIGGIAARATGVPAVSTIHEVVQLPKGMARAKGEVFALGRRFGDARVIAVSDRARDAYLKLNRGMDRRVVRIHNGIDVAAAPGSGVGVREELGIAPDELLVGMVSALRPEKAHNIAIEAVGLLRERFPKLRLLIAGQGPSAPALELLAEGYGDRVLFTGRRTDVMSIFDALDVCLHPSHIDAFPTTLVEALAASTPILASDVGGIPEIVDDGHTGILMPAPPTPDGVASALGVLLADLPLRGALARSGREAYLERFTAGPWVMRTRALYDEVIAERNHLRWRRDRLDSERDPDSSSAGVETEAPPR
jgi:glycosyltransferase involved in cell wall biosynthesis